MCLSCGCHRPWDEHDNAANITYPDLVEAAEAAGITISAAASNILSTVAQVNASHR